MCVWKIDTTTRVQHSVVQRLPKLIKKKKNERDFQKYALSLKPQKEPKFLSKLKLVRQMI